MKMPEILIASLKMNPQRISKLNDCKKFASPMSRDQGHYQFFLLLLIFSRLCCLCMVKFDGLNHSRFSRRISFRMVTTVPLH